MLLHRPPNSPAAATGAATTPSTGKEPQPQACSPNGRPPGHSIRQDDEAVHGGSLSDRTYTPAPARDYIPDPTKRQVTTTGREPQVLNGPGAVGSPEPSPGQACWQPSPRGRESTLGALLGAPDHRPRKKRHRRWQRYSARLPTAVEPGASPKQPRQVQLRRKTTLLIVLEPARGLRQSRYRTAPAASHELPCPRCGRKDHPVSMLVATRGTWTDQRPVSWTDCCAKLIMPLLPLELPDTPPWESGGRVAGSATSCCSGRRSC